MLELALGDPGQLESRVAVLGVVLLIHAMIVSEALIAPFNVDVLPVSGGVVMGAMAMTVRAVRVTMSRTAMTSDRVANDDPQRRTPDSRP